MPGIVGLITKMPHERAMSELARMVGAISHESFYTTGTWAEESLGVYVGWAARKNSFADGMPLHNERGDVTLIFSGEEYPEPGTISDLKKRGHSLDVEGSSYLVHRYEDDPSFPTQLNGLFHGVLVDRTRGTTMLFNDRFGIHRMYYHESKDAFYFAVEAKAILTVRPELRTPDARALGEFIACGCMLENRTLFDRINVLPGGSAWTFFNSTIERTTYFQPVEWENQSALDPDAYYREICDTFSHNLPRYFNGHERVGVALTGGLDTRMIMAWRNAAPRSLPCYTFGSTLRENQDVRVARQVSQVCDQPHQVIGVGEEFLTRFSHYAERTVYLTEGCVEVNRSPDLYVSEKARQIAPTKVVGTYGSEVLTVVPMFKPEDPRPGLYSRDLLPYVQQAGDTYAGLRREHPVTFAAFRQSPWWHFGVLSLEQTQLSVRSPYLDNAFLQTVYRAPKSGGAGRDVRWRLIGEGNPRLAQVPTDRGLGGNRGSLAAAVARAFQEFTFRAEYAYDSAMPQWLARVDHLFSRVHFERLFLGRHKVFHFRVWYRDALAQYVREILLDSKTLARPYLERSSVEEIVKGHLKGDRNYTNEIHKLLTLELLHRQFFDQK